MKHHERWLGVAIIVGAAAGGALLYLLTQVLVNVLLPR
jgi:hypothetical protein